MVRMFFVIIGCLVLVLVSCVTTNNVSTSDTHLKNQSVVVQKKEGYKDSSNSALNTNDTQLNSYQNLIDFILRHSNPDAPFFEKDEEVLASISSEPIPGSLEEAVLVIGTLKKYIKSQLPQTSYEEQDIKLQDQLQTQSLDKTTDQNISDKLSENKSNDNIQMKPQETLSKPVDSDFASNTTTKSVDKTSLEDAFLQKKLNLIAALEKNIFLQNVSVYRMVLLAISFNQLPQNQDSQNIPLENSMSTGLNNNFNQSIYQLVSHRINEWTSLQKTFSIPSQPQENITSSDKESQTSSQSQHTLSLADLNKGDELLLEAQILADNKKYKEAIMKAELIPQTSPFYSAAQEKIVFFSDLAVQDLRKKAADIYQYVFSVSDTKVKVSYLKEAKKFLMLALSEYPKASLDQLSKVKNNLEIINRELDSLEKDLSHK